MLRRFRKNPLRTVLTLLQIFLGALAMTLALSAYFGATAGQSQQPDRFDLISGEIDKDGSSSTNYLMDAAGAKEVLALAPDVKKVSLYMQMWSPEVASGGKLYQVQQGAYVDADYFALSDISLVKGTVFGSQDASSEAAVALISEGAANILFEDEDPLSQSITLMPSGGFVAYDEEGNELPSPEPEVFQIIGTFAQKTGNGSEVWNQSHLYLPMWKSGDQAGDTTDTLNILAKPGRGEAARAQIISAARQAYAARLNDWGIEEGKDFYVREMGDDGFSQTQNDLLDPTVVMFGLFGIIALIVGSIGIFSIQLVDALERERDTSIRRALGATRGRVVRDMTLEASFLAGLGGLLGAASAALIIPLLTRGVGGSLFWSLELRWQPLAAFIVVAMTLVLGLVLGIFPALRAGRTDVVQALKGA